MRKKLTTLFLLALLTSSLAFAATSWSLNNGVLTISGAGAMTDCEDPSGYPWASSSDAVQAVVVESGVTSIGKYAFYEFCNINTVTLAATVTSIGEEAFYGCTCLTKVRVDSDNGNAGSGTGTIGASAFFGCSNLESITIPEGVTSIERAAFVECCSLATIILLPTTPPDYHPMTFEEDVFDDIVLVVPDGKIQTYKNESAWGDFSKIYSTTLSNPINNSYVSWSFNRATGTLTISGNGVIPNYGDSSETPWVDYLEDIQKLVIESGVTSIGTYAFSYCQGLESVILPSTLTSIGTYAFTMCMNLKSITIPEGITRIERETFLSCMKLSELSLPSTITYLGAQAFAYAPLETVVCLAQNPPTCSDEWEPFYNDFEDKPDCVLYVPANSVERYTGWQGFNDVRAYAIPSTIHFAFSDFDDDGYLQIVTISGSGAMADYECEGSPLYDDAEAIRTATIESGITSIGAYTFYDCGQLSSVTLPSTITSIGEGAFSKCRNMASITIPAGVTTIGNNAFDCCTYLRTITFLSTTPFTYRAAIFGEDFEPSFVTLVVPAGCKATYQTAGWADFNITEAGSSNPTTVAQGPAGANITWTLTNNGALTFTGSGEMYDFGWSECSTSDWVQNYRDDITSIVIGEGITNIGSGAFYGCNHLTSLTLPSTLKTIQDYAFSYCTALLSVTLPAGVTYIGEYAFSSCTSLATVDVDGDSDTPSASPAIRGESLTKMSATNASAAQRIRATDDEEPETQQYILGVNAFVCCSNLTSVTIPADITTIGDGAFYGCDNLTTITFLSENPPTYNPIIFGLDVENPDVTFIVPVGCKDAYESAGWTDFTIVDLERCATPVITCTNGKIAVTCATPDAKCHCTYSFDCEGQGDNMEGSRTITITAYATATDHLDSATATVTFDQAKLGGGTTGDVNGDGQVDVTDVTKLVDIILHAE